MLKKVQGNMTLHYNAALFLGLVVIGSLRSSIESTSGGFGKGFVDTSVLLC